MITEIKRSSLTSSTAVVEYVGLSTDRKPASLEPNISLGNGSSFFEMDTGVTYWYDGGSFKWIAPGVPSEDVDLSDMTKAQLLEYAQEHGIEADPKAKKADIIKQIKE